MKTVVRVAQSLKLLDVEGKLLAAEFVAGLEESTSVEISIERLNNEVFCGVIARRPRKPARHVSACTSCSRSRKL